MLKTEYQAINKQVGAEGLGNGEVQAGRRASRGDGETPEMMPHHF
jgi:hypothetical protein